MPAAAKGEAGAPGKGKGRRTQQEAARREGARRGGASPSGPAPAASAVRAMEVDGTTAGCPGPMSTEGSEASCATMHSSPSSLASLQGSTGEGQAAGGRPQQRQHRQQRQQGPPQQAVPEQVALQQQQPSVEGQAGEQPAGSGAPLAASMGARRKVGADKACCWAKMWRLVA